MPVASLADVIQTLLDSSVVVGLLVALAGALFSSRVAWTQARYARRQMELSSRAVRNLDDPEVAARFLITMEATRLRMEAAGADAAAALATAEEVLAAADSRARAHVDETTEKGGHASDVKGPRDEGHA